MLISLRSRSFLFSFFSFFFSAFFLFSFLYSLFSLFSFLCFSFSLFSFFSFSLLFNSFFFILLFSLSYLSLFSHSALSHLRSLFLSLFLWNRIWTPKRFLWVVTTPTLRTEKRELDVCPSEISCEYIEIHIALMFSDFLFSLFSFIFSLLFSLLFSLKSSLILFSFLDLLNKLLNKH